MSETKLSRFEYKSGTIESGKLQKTSARKSTNPKKMFLGEELSKFIDRDLHMQNTEFL